MSTFEHIFSGDKFFHIRDKVLNYVIHARDGSKLSPTDIQACRLVNKSFLHSVSLCLRKSREVLFQIHLKNETPNAQEGERRVDQFLCLFNGKSRLDNLCPPIKITISEDFFHRKNLQKFVNFLIHFGDSLVDIEIAFPLNGGSMTFIFPPRLSFKLLHRFTLLLRGEDGLPVNDEEATVLGKNSNLTYLVGTIFNGCESLKEFKIPFMRVNEHLIPYGFEQLNLPTSLTKLELMTPLEEMDFEILAKNSLPNLQKLFLRIPLRPLADGLIFKIFARVSGRLEKLVLAGFPQEGQLEIPATKIWLPVMAKLKELVICGVHIELESRLSPMAKCVPKLERLRLLYHTSSMFRKWAENSAFKSVTNFGVTLVDDESLPLNDENYSAKMDHKMVELIHKGFPNLTHLYLNKYGMEITGMCFIFRHMKQLVSLQIQQNKNERISSSDHWDALLTGIPVEWIGQLRESRKLWNDLRILSMLRPAITNMTNLESLVLRTDGSSSTNAPNESLISDIAFHFGFLRMPRLTTLTLKGRFKVSDEIAEKWRTQTRPKKFKFQAPVSSRKCILED